MRALAPLSALVSIGAIVVFALGGFWADGEALEHAREHALIAAVAGALAALVGGRWQADLPSFSAVARLAFVGSLLFLAVAQLIESIGALGYDESGEVVRRQSADELHSLGSWLTTPALVALLAGTLIALFYAATRIRTWRRHPAAR
jgi:type III secretory pathway component EscS